MKSFVSNDNTSSQKRGQGGLTIKVEPSCHGIHVDADISWEAAGHFDCLFVALGKFQQAIKYQRTEVEQREKRRATNDNIYEARKSENLSKGERYAEGLESLCAEGYTRHDALSQIAKSYGMGIKEVETLIKLYNQKTKRELKAERLEKAKFFMLIGKSASEIGKELGVSKSEAHRIMQSVEGTGDE